MEKHMKLAKVASVVGLCTLCATTGSIAMAEDVGWYLGASGGKTYATIDRGDIRSNLIGAGFLKAEIDGDERDSGYKLFGGYQLSRNFALEAGYFNLGEFGYTATTLPAGGVRARLEIEGINLDFVGLHYFNEKLAIFGRMGVNYAESDVRFTDSGLAHVFDAHENDRDLHYKLGFGLQYSMTPALDLRLEAERYRINDAVGETGDIDMASIGLVYRFGQNKPAPVKTAYTPPPKAAAPAPTPVVVTVPATEEYCTILNVEFTINESGIQLADAEKLKVVGTFMNKYPGTTAVIGGHSDNVGNPDSNMKLSRDRAQSVVDFLVKTHNIDRSRLKAVAFGETKPLASNATAEGQRANRRVSAVIGCATDVEGLTPAAARLTMALQMEFNADEAVVLPRYRDELKSVAKYMTDHPEVSATIQGHASNLNKVSAAGSLELSRQRAANVANYLVTNHGIARSRFTIQGFGEADRFAYNTTAEGQQDNQRVNIVFTY